MAFLIPGTVHSIPMEEVANIPDIFASMFMVGDLALRQVSGLTGLAAYDIQNWVKRGYLTKPENKHYTLRQLCRIININMLKAVLPLERICAMLGYVNGQLDDERDDMIDDADLYFMFVGLAARSRELYREENREAVLDEALFDYAEPMPGAKERVKTVLRIMLTAWLAARMTQEAEKMLIDL